MEKGELEVVLDLPGHSNRSLGFVTKFGRGEEAVLRRSELGSNQSERAAGRIHLRSSI
jgi:hypothetical protein